MKIIYKIGIALFILILIFLLRNNLKDAYNNSYLSINKGIELVFNFKDKLMNNTIDLSSTSESNNKIKASNIKNVYVSGPLKVINNLISNNSEIKLSKENIINITNQNRKENGDLSALAENSKLDFSAEKKVQDMFTKQYFEHTSPDGIGVGDLGTQVGYDYIIIGENLALGNFKDDKALVDAWMASPGHRANILNKRYTEIGVAVAKGQYEGKEVWIAVQHFGLPKSACPSIDEGLHQIINFNQDKAKTLSSELSTLRANIDKGTIYEGKTISEQIDIYNFKISDYNELISEIKTKITQYNNQVNAFNSCISINA